MHKTGFLVFVFIIMTAASVPGQAPGAPALQEDSVSISATEIRVDLIVRDKRGRPVRGLTAADFQVYEDGERQDISSLRFVGRDTGPEAPTKGERGESSADRRPGRSPTGLNVVALVFDRLDPDARARAHRAARQYIAEVARPDDFLGVFLLDLSLRALQQYTTDKQAVRTAVETAASTAVSTYKSSAQTIRNLNTESPTVTLGPPKYDVEYAGPSVGRGGDADEQLRRMTLLSLEGFEILQRTQQGYATTNGLLAIVRALGLLPGRKAIIFFSSGVMIPPQVLPQFESVINSANRAGVSIYAVDAAGLRAETPSAEAVREAMTPRPSSLGALPPLTRSLERLEDAMRSGPESGLAQLANETGGFFINHTNDPGSRFRQINEDLRTHYVLTYAPKNADFDGRFRKISVKVKRDDVSVQSRAGYYAITNLGNLTVLPHETRALALLGSGRNKLDFPLRAVGLSFPQPSKPGLVSVLIEAPARAFTYTVDPQANTFSASFSYVALIRDSAGRVVSKMSQPYELKGSRAELERAQRGDVLFYRELELKPGQYTLEIAAYDAPTGKASTHRAPLDVSTGDGNLRLSSVVIVKRAEKIDATEPAWTSPLRAGDLLLYPNLGEALSRKSTPQVAFFVTLYPARGGIKPRMMVEVWQGGRSLMRLPADLPEPDANGRIQVLNALPLASFAPGAYELRISATDEASVISRSVRFDVVP